MFDHMQDQQESTFHNINHGNNDYGDNDGPDMLETLSLCILNDKPTWWIPVYSHFLDEETKTLNGLSCLPYIGQHSSDWLPFFPPLFTA